MSGRKFAWISNVLNLKLKKQLFNEISKLRIRQLKIAKLSTFFSFLSFSPLFCTGLSSVEL